MTQPKPKIRLYLPAAFSEGKILEADPGQSHYLAQVMRLDVGDQVSLFNGKDGEWRAEIAQLSKKKVALQLLEQLVAQAAVPDVWLAFAPIKAKVELVVEKAVELGVSRLLTVVTQHAVVRSVNQEKLEAHAKEAAEQCGRHDVPPLAQYRDLRALLGDWPKDRLLLHADECGGGIPFKTLLPALPEGSYGVLIGPEGGFSPEERKLLAGLPFVKSFSMGPRILRADTASVAALACVMSWLGDWEKSPSFESGE